MAGCLGSLLLMAVIYLSTFPAVAQADVDAIDAANTLRLGTFGVGNSQLEKAEGPIADRMRELARRVECALGQQGQSLTLVHGALKRIQLKIKNGDVDGFLFALRSAERDEFMVPLVPAFSSGIRLYWLKGRVVEPLVKSSLRIAHLKGAAYRLEKYQLENQVVAHANEPRGLVGMLLRGRVDAVLGNDQGFGGIIDGLGVKYDSELLDDMTFYVQVSKRYLSQHPAFAQTFVASMVACASAAVE